MSVEPARVCALWRQLRKDPLQAGAWSALARDYAARQLHWQAGYAARQALRLDPSLRASLAQLPCVAPGADGDRQLGRASLTQAEQLIEQFQAALAAHPGDWLSWLYVARLREFTPAAQSAGEDLRHAMALEPMAGESLHWLGVWRLHAGDHAGAVAALAGLVDLRPVRHGSMMVLGEALKGVGQGAAASKAFARAAHSSHPALLLALAQRVAAHDGPQAALALLHKALTLQYNAYALAECGATLAAIRAIDPNDQSLAMFDMNLAERLGDAGAFLAALRAQCGPEGAGDPLAPYRLGLPMAALYVDALPAAEVAALHRSACAPLPAAPARARMAFAHARDPDRALRIGWVSADLHDDHPVNQFMRPLLTRLDRSRCEHVVYDTGCAVHGGAPRLGFGHARHAAVGALGDEALGRLIVDDGIDILIDLAGHSSCRRLGVFAGRAAPVQASFLGYPHSTGLAAMDWLIGDAVVSPAAHAPLFSEGLAQLPGSVFCWTPPAHYELPAERPAGAPLVFGSFNNAMKLSPRTIAIWSNLLRQLPDSRLLLKSAALGDPAIQARYRKLFGERGIDPQRLELRGLSDLRTTMGQYGDVDIALDPMPYNGGTTTLQALWMGVPVVTLAGDNFVGRMGASFMQSLGRPEWVARDDAAYVKAAVDLAGQRHAVRAGRPRLREQMRTSSLGDIETYARHFEVLLHAMWRSYCENDGKRLLPAATIAQLARTLYP